MDKHHIDYLTPEFLKSSEDIWVNPVGGLGDIIMLSTALYESYNKYNKKFFLARRSQYTDFFARHPAIQSIGNPPMGSNIVCNDYWMREEFKNPNVKALAIILKIFGLTDFTGDNLFLPQSVPTTKSKMLLEMVPWREKNVAIVFSSESPRKIMHPVKWHRIVEQLLSQQCFVVQIGRIGDVHIHGTYSLLGTTSPLEVMDIIKKVDLVITLDNYIMHLSKLAQTPAIVLFGPTEASRYGYSGQICLQADVSKCEFANMCLGPHVSENYNTPCPLQESHCMNRHDENKIVDIAMTILNKR